MPEKLDTERNGAEELMERRIRETVRWQDFGTRITFFASQSDFDLSHPERVAPKKSVLRQKSLRNWDPHKTSLHSRRGLGLPLPQTKNDYSVIAHLTTLEVFNNLSYSWFFLFNCGLYLKLCIRNILQASICRINRSFKKPLKRLTAGHVFVCTNE